MSEPRIDFRVRLPAELRPAAPVGAGLAEGYDAVLGMSATHERTTGQLLEDLRDADVSHAVVHAEHEQGEVADALNEAVASLCASEDNLLGFGTVSLEASSASRMVRQVRAVARLGLRGLNLQPAFFGRAIDDAPLFAVYAAAEEEGLVVAVHTGVHYDRSRPMDGEQPVHLDHVASQFESLRLVACHGGWPWTAELAAVARRHPNVFVDFGAVAPKYVGRAGTGWDPLFALVDNVLAEQVLFASDWPALSPVRLVTEWKGLGLKDSTLAGLFGGNASRLLSWPT